MCSRQSTIALALNIFSDNVGSFSVYVRPSLHRCVGAVCIWAGVLWGSSERQDLIYRLLVFAGGIENPESPVLTVGTNW